MANLGVAQLEALLESDLLDEAEKVFVETALDAVYDGPEAVQYLEDDDMDVASRGDSSMTDEALELGPADEGGPTP